MREIKFCGKRKDNGEWIYGFLINKYHWNGQKYAVSQSFIIPIEINVNILVANNLINGKDVYEVIPESVGQYIDFKDKNGKEIYEGDIVKINDPHGKTYIGNVVYSEKDAAFIVDGFYCSSCDNPTDFTELIEYAEVIGKYL